MEEKVEETVEYVKPKKRKIFLKAILGFFIILLVATVIHTVKSYLIMSEIQNNVAKYVDSTNYYTKIINSSGEGIITTTQYYRKGDKEAVKIERNIDGEITKMSVYKNDGKTNTYIETEDSKIARLNTETILSIKIYDYFQTENIWQKIMGSIITRFGKTNVNGREAYTASSTVTLLSFVFDEENIVIDRQTGLAIRIIDIEADSCIRREYEFNNVDDSVFEEPDISQYTIRED